MLDVLIKNANIIDGTGKPAYKAASVFRRKAGHGRRQ